MSIKVELENLRNEQKQQEEKIRMEYAKRDVEKEKLRETQQNLTKFENRKSELAKRISEQYGREKKESTENLKKIDKIIEQYDKDYLANEKRIKELYCDTSFYINEQVSYLIQKLTSYIEENEVRLGINIITIFTLKPCGSFIGRVPYDYVKPTGYFELKQGDEIIAKTKDYYFDDNKIVIGVDNDYRPILSDWYKEYEKDFMEFFGKSLKEEFRSENFKLVSIDNRLGNFRIELI